MTAPSIKEAFVQYRRTQIAEMTPWVEGSDMRYVSVSAIDASRGSPKAGDMIARNPKCHTDQWLVAAAYFADNFEPLATFQPDGERREALARAICTAKDVNPDCLHQNYDDNEPIDHTDARGRTYHYGWRNQLHIADAILASGLVQNEAGWRDSGTVPMDGTNVLIAEDHRGSSGEAYYDAEEGRWYWANTGRGDYPTPHEPFPTHWQPLPVPPIRSARDGGAET